MSIKQDSVVLVTNTKQYTQIHNTLFPLPPVGYLRLTLINKLKILPDKTVGFFCLWLITLVMHHGYFYTAHLTEERTAASYKHKRRTLLLLGVGALSLKEAEVNHSHWVWALVLFVLWKWPFHISGVLLWKVLLPVVFYSWMDYLITWLWVCVGWLCCT